MATAPPPVRVAASVKGAVASMKAFGSRARPKAPPVPRLSGTHVKRLPLTELPEDDELEESYIPDCGVEIVPRARKTPKDYGNDSFESEGSALNKEDVIAAPLVKPPAYHARPSLHKERNKDDGPTDETKTPFAERQEAAKRVILSKGKQFLAEQQRRRRLDAHKAKVTAEREKSKRTQELQKVNAEARENARKPLPPHLLSKLAPQPARKSPKKVEVYVDPDDDDDDGDENDGENTENRNNAGRHATAGPQRRTVDGSPSSTSGGGAWSSPTPMPTPGKSPRSGGSSDKSASSSGSRGGSPRAIGLTPRRASPPSRVGAAQYSGRSNGSVGEHKSTGDDGGDDVEEEDEVEDGRAVGHDILDMGDSEVDLYGDGDGEGDTNGRRGDDDDGGRASRIGQIHERIRQSVSSRLQSTLGVPGW